MQDTNYFVTTRLDGTDLRTGKIDYANAFATKTPIVVEAPESQKNVWDDDRYPRALVSSYDTGDPALGVTWPNFRLFAVTGTPMENYGSTVVFNRLTVVSELDTYHALGRRGNDVLDLIEQANNASEQTRQELLSFAYASHFQHPAYRGISLATARESLRKVAEGGRQNIAVKVLDRVILDSVHLNPDWNDIEAHTYREAVSDAFLAVSLVGYLRPEYAKTLLWAWESAMGDVKDFLHDLSRRRKEERYRQMQEEKYGHIF